MKSLVSGVAFSIVFGWPRYSIPIKSTWFDDANTVIQDDGFFDVIGHGSATHIAIADAIPMTADDLAKLIRESPEYVAGMGIRLISCNTVAAADGFASQLSRLLGVPVKASTAPVSILRGVLHLWKLKDGTPSVWRIFFSMEALTFLADFQDRQQC